MKQTPAGWYIDPWNTRKIRYWNGQQWTSQTGRVPVAARASGARWSAAALLLVAALALAIFVPPLVLS